MKNEAATCITQVAAFSFLTNFLINYSKCYYLYMDPRASCPGVVCYFKRMIFSELAGISTVAPFFSVVT